ncbi:MAG TPA: L-ribulose-5-phosphate 3-epimerase [Clostridiaceae bacterium]|nr:L-ribulose-5-phosphate 3-epimerase [Clostridiaceae bacterium]
MNQYYLGLYEKSMPNSLTIKEKLFNVKSAGFDFMEISIDESEEKLSRLKWDKQQKFSLIRDMYEADVRILTMCLSGHRKYPLGSQDSIINNRSMEIMADAIDFAADVGIRIIQIAGYDEYYNESNQRTKELFLENLRISVQIASQKGIILAFETMETEFMNTVSKAMHYVNKVNSPYLKIYPDLGNITNAANGDSYLVSDDLRTGEGNIVAMHLKETVPGKFREVPFGSGHVNFSKGIRTASDMGVNMYVAEFWYTGDDNWQQELINTNLFLKDKFSSAKEMKE